METSRLIERRRTAAKVKEVYTRLGISTAASRARIPGTHGFQPVGLAECPRRRLASFPVGLAWALWLLGAGHAACAESGVWAEVRVLGPFVFRSEFPLGEVQALIGELGSLQADLVQTLRIPPAAERIEVCLFRDKGSYSRFLAEHFRNVTYRRALYVKDGGPGLVLAHRNPEFANDLRHECTHALLHAVIPVVPLWLDEGLAKYFEAPQSKRAYGHPYLSSVRWSVRLGGLQTIEDLERKTSVGDMGNSEYRAAWAWVHFCLHGSPEARAELVRFLADLRLGNPAGLLSARLRERSPGLEGYISTHFRKWKAPPEPRLGRAGDAVLLADPFLRQ